MSDGTPVFPGAETCARELFEHLARGGSTDTFLRDCPRWRREQVEVVLRRAKKILLEDIEDQRDIDFARLHEHEPTTPLEEVIEELGISKEKVGL